MKTSLTDLELSLYEGTGHDFKKVIPILSLFILFLCSCESRSGSKGRYAPEPTSSFPVRVKILSTGLITHGLISSIQKDIFRPLDTVYINTTTHEIDDTGTGKDGVRAVIYIHN